MPDTLERAVTWRRAVDILCLPHVDEVMDFWSHPLPLDELTNECPHCARKRAAVRADTGGVNIRALPDLSDDEYALSAAIHEASHAAVSVATGHPLIEVILSATVHEGEAEGGMVRHGPFKMPLAAHLAMVWAGQLGVRRWLTLRGLDTVENRVDVSNLGRHDAADIRWETESRSVPHATGRRVAETFLDLNWPAVERLAALLVDRRHVDGSTVRKLVLGDTGSKAVGEK